MSTSAAVPMTPVGSATPPGPTATGTTTAQLPAVHDEAAVPASAAVAGMAAVAGVAAVAGAASAAVAGAPPKAAAVLRADPDAVRRRELSAFLRSRRERLTPGQAGLPIGGRRRTPGLRREEVAQLAGVGVTWYTWLEQGRDIRASEQVVQAISRTLQLDNDERAHLLTLAGLTHSVSREQCDAVSEATLRLIEQLEPFPACIQTAKYDLVAYNRPYAHLVGNIETKPTADRNCMWLVFTDPEWRKCLPDWDVVAARMVAQFRAQMAEHFAEPAWKAHLKRLKAASPEFVALWDKHEIASAQGSLKRFRNPHVGDLSFDVTMSWLAPRPGLRMMVYTPSDQQTERRVARLLEIVTAAASA